MEVLKTPIKSESDKKEYRLIKLENGLKVLLISKTDDTEGKSLSACSLCAFVGSYDNPPHVPGLAHFFEHMIFLDPGNYEMNFKKYIDTHGGYCNAMTGNDLTNYIFDVNDEIFPEALIRLSEIFTSPMLSKNLMQSERINVDSEFRMSKQQPSTRIAHLHRLYLNQEHHASRFPTGNLQTLKDNISDDDLHSELVKFLDNYVANKMALCCQSIRPLDEMQKLVVDNFSSIKRNDEIKFNYEDPVNFDELVRPEFYSKVLYLKDSNINTLTFSWILPPSKKHYKSKPFTIINKIFHNSDEGGLKEFLKEKHFITDLEITHTTWLTSSQFLCLQLDLELTDTGLENIEDVLSAVYSYLLMLKNTPCEEYQRFVNDLRKDVELFFRFSEESFAVQNVRIATDMMTFDDEDLVRGQSGLLEYDEDILMDYIDKINNGKFNITFLTKSHANFPLREETYELEYDEIDMPENFKRIWDERKSNPNFFLDKPNPYKVENIEIFKDEEEFDHPEKIFKNEVIEIWHVLDRKFNRPHVKVVIKVITKDYCKNVKLHVYMLLLSKLASEIFKKRFSKSKKAGLSSDIVASYDYLEFTFSGYNDKMLILIEETFEEFKKIIENLEESKFIKKKDEYRKDLRDFSFYPDDIGSDELSKILSNSYYTDFDVFQVLDTITFENFKTSIKDTFTQLKAVTLVQGNMRKEDALKLAEIFQRNFECEKLDENYQIKTRGYQISQGSNTLRIKSINPVDDLSYISNYYQYGPYTIRTKNLASMLEIFMIPKSFDFLRSKHQLSYRVKFSMKNLERVIGFVLSVQSHEDINDYLKVSGKMEELINIIGKESMMNMTDEEFETIKKGRIHELSQPNLTIGEEFSQNMREIIEEAYNFNRTSEAIEDAKKIMKADLQQFFESVFDPQQMRKLIIQVIGKTKVEVMNEIPDDTPKMTVLTEKTDIDENIITDVDEFKKTMFLYPVNYN